MSFSVVVLEECLQAEPFREGNYLSMVLVVRAGEWGIQWDLERSEIRGDTASHYGGSQGTLILLNPFHCSDLEVIIRAEREKGLQNGALASEKWKEEMTKKICHSFTLQSVWSSEFMTYAVQRNIFHGIYCSRRAVFHSVRSGCFCGESASQKEKEVAFVQRRFLKRALGKHKLDKSCWETCLDINELQMSHVCTMKRYLLFSHDWEHWEAPQILNRMKNL